MILQLQKERIKSFLNTSDQSPWKILILDQKTQEILAPLIRVNELRELYITCHFLINNKRQPIRDVSAIYFIDATKENVKSVINDVQSDLYSSYNLNFLNSISREDLENLANSLSEKGKGFFVKSVFDQFTDFLSLQENFFTLGCKNSFSEKVDETKIINSLFGVFLTLKEAPFIIYDEKNKEIAEKLTKKIKHSSLIKDTRKKPLLVLLDRNFDLKTPLEHVWTYGALIDDLLVYENNKVYLKDDEKYFDLDPNDEFWLENKDEYFPVVAEKVENELTEYKKEMALRCVDEKSDQKKIEETLEKAPELAKKKASLHMHMNICLSLVEIIKKRSIDDFYKIEKSSFKNKDILEITEKGTDDDILRLGVSILKEDNFNVVEAMFKARKINTSFLNLFKSNSDLQPKEGTFYKQVVSNVLGSVKKLLPVNTDCPISLHVEKIVNAIKNQNFTDINLKIPYGNHCFEKEISKIVVFFNGGGNFTELKALNELSRKINLEIIYGSTEIVNASKMIDQFKKVVK